MSSVAILSIVHRVVNKIQNVLALRNKKQTFSIKTLELTLFLVITLFIKRMCHCTAQCFSMQLFLCMWITAGCLRLRA